jgi:hypothetical protein
MAEQAAKIAGQISKSAERSEESAQLLENIAQLDQYELSFQGIFSDAVLISGFLTRPLTSIHETSEVLFKQFDCIYACSD